MTSVITTIDYYEAYRELLEETLDELIEATRTRTDETPSTAFCFAAVRTGLASDPASAATIAALALMRLAAHPNGGGDGAS